MCVLSDTPCEHRKSTSQVDTRGEESLNEQNSFFPLKINGKTCTQVQKNGNYTKLYNRKSIVKNLLTKKEVLKNKCGLSYVKPITKLQTDDRRATAALASDGPVRGVFMTHITNSKYALASIGA